MINLDKALLNLLQKKQKASLTALGVFSVKNISAEVHPVNHTFSPPHAELIFEENSISESECLTVFISDTFNINNEEAATLVNQYCNTIKQNLTQNSKHFFEGIGSLKKESDGTFFFKILPDVLLNPQHIGLKEFVSPAIKRNKKAQQTLPKAKPKRKLKWLIASSIVVFIIATAAASFFVFPDYVKPYINPLIENVQAYSYKLFKKEEKTANLGIKDTPKNEKQKAPPIIEKKNKVEEPPVTQIDEGILEGLPETIETPVKQTTSKQKYYIVAGSFKNLENAENYAKQLKEGNYPGALMLPEPRKGFYTVVFAGYDNRETAEKELIRIGSVENGNYWIIND